MSLLVCIVAAGCGQAGTHRETVLTDNARATSTTSAAVAARAASELLGMVVLPPGSTAVARAPSIAAALLDQPGPDARLARVADRHRLWISRERPLELLEFVAGHAPSGTRIAGSGDSQRRGRTFYWWEDLDVLPRAGSPGSQQLVVAVASAGSGRFALRADARVAWHLRRPASTLLGGTVRDVVIAVERASAGPGQRRSPRVVQSLVLSSPSAVRALVTAVNGLPLAEPNGPLSSCPALGGESFLLLSFRGSNRERSVADVRVGPLGCGAPVVSLSIPSSPPVALGGGQDLVKTVELTVGVPLQGLRAGS